MIDIYLIHTKLILKVDIYSHVVMPPYFSVLQKKKNLLLLLLLIMFDNSYPWDKLSMYVAKIMGPLYLRYCNLSSEP